MQKSSWRKRIAILKERLYLYPAPEPLPHSGWFWLAMALVTTLAAAFALFFIVYLAQMQDAFLTAAEDVGIIDQAFWNLAHGQFFHQTICNSISDSNCHGLQGFPRFAIHFEPILFLLAPLYLLWPGPKILMIVQTLVVASGAFPAFWLARLRLRSELAGVGIATLYLLYPSLQQAEIAYFHAVTMVAALLLFTLYFLYTRRTVALFLCALLTLACKEEIALTIAMLGLWSLLFQHGWRSGLGLVALAVAWLGLDMWMFHLFSPIQHPLLAARYAYLGHGPLKITLTVLRHPLSLLQTHVLEHDHLFYLRLLLSSVSYLALLAPWVLILAVPALALNLLSSDPNQYQGLYQYNAEIVPLLIFAALEATVVLLRVAQWTGAYPVKRRGEDVELGMSTCQARPGRSRGQMSQRLMLCAALCIMLLGVLHHERSYGALPFSQDYIWPQVTAHEKAAQHFIKMIPANASVSAQSSLVPHLSQREHIYLYPYGVGFASYIFLDVTSDTYPYAPAKYNKAVKSILLHGDYGVVAAQDGYLLLKRGLPAPGPASPSPVAYSSTVQPELPPPFCSFIHTPSQAASTHAQVDFQAPGGGLVSLVGFQVQRPGAFLRVITYWKVNRPNIAPVRIHASLLNTAGQELFSSNNFTGASWCPSNTWQPGQVVQMCTRLMYIGNVRRGQAHIVLALLPDKTTSVTMGNRTKGLPFHIVQSPGTVTAVPGTRLVQLQTITVS